MRPKLIIFAKAPVMGHAKTRLAADIGPVHAKRIYRAMMSRTIRSVRSPKWDTRLAVTPAHWVGRVKEWDGTPQYHQTSGSLSPRLAQAFACKGPTVVIGTDSPQIMSHDIHTAFRALKKQDAVLGPADDGGFWLIGLNGPAKRGLFDDIRWSTSQALADMADNISGSIHRLRTLTDVDDARALAQVRQVVRL